MKRRICAALLVVLVSVFSFASGTAQTATSGTSSALMTDYQVTTVGSTNWASSLTAPAGTTVSWLLTYHNMGTTNVGKLIISSSLVANQTLVPGSVMWFDGNFPNGYKLSDTGLFDAGVDVGGVAAGTNGFIRYRTQSVETTPCGITSESAGYFDADGVKSSYKATYATPACIETASAAVAPTTTALTTTNSTDVTTSTTTTHDHTTTTAAVPIVATSAIPQTSATPPVATGDTVTTAVTPVAATTTSSTMGTVHEAHDLSTVSSTSTGAASTVTPAATSTTPTQTAVATVETSHTDHTTTTQSASATPVVAQANPTVATAVADTSTHASHSVAATPTVATSAAQVAGASTETAAHTDHATTTPAPTAVTNQSAEHSGHTIPATGGNPLWLMSGALAFGYIGKLLLLKRKMRAQSELVYWQ